MNFCCSSRHGVNYALRRHANCNKMSSYKLLLQALKNTDLGIELLWINVSRPGGRIRLASVSFLFRSIFIPPHFYGVTGTFLKWCCMCAKSAHVVIRMQLHHSIYSKHSELIFRNRKGHRFKKAWIKRCQNVGIMLKGSYRNDLTSLQC